MQQISVQYLLLFKNYNYLNLILHLSKRTSSVQFLAFVNVFMMGNVSNNDKMLIQMLHEQGFGAKVIRGSYPDKTGA